MQWDTLAAGAGVVDYLVKSCKSSVVVVAPAMGILSPAQTQTFVLTRFQ